MKLVKHERKIGNRSGGPGGICDISDYDVVEGDKIIAELWEMCYENMKKYDDEHKRVPDETVKILMPLLAIQELEGLRSCVNEWLKKLNPPRIHINNDLEVDKVTGIVDKDDEKRIKSIKVQLEFKKVQLELKKAIIELTDEFRHLQGKVDNVLYTYEGVLSGDNLESREN